MNLGAPDFSGRNIDRVVPGIMPQQLKALKSHKTLAWVYLIITSELLIQTMKDVKKLVEKSDIF